MAKQSDARVWLRDNGYVDAANMIDEIMAEWATLGKKTRRNWWDKLAGTRDGRPCTVAGRAFPVLAAARSRKGYPAVGAAVARSGAEAAPGIVLSNRWPRR